MWCPGSGVVLDCIILFKPSIYICLTYYLPNLTLPNLTFCSKIVSEYDQEIPQSQTTDNPVAL